MRKRLTAIDVIKQLSSEHKNCKNELKRKVEELNKEMEKEKRKCDNEIKKIQDEHSFKLDALKIASAEIVVEMTAKSDKISKFCKEKVLENAKLKSENANLKQKVQKLEVRVAQLEQNAERDMEKIEKLQQDVKTAKEKIEELHQNAEKFRDLYEKQNTRIEALFAQVSNSQQI